MAVVHAFWWEMLVGMNSSIDGVGVCPSAERERTDERWVELVWGLGGAGTGGPMMSGRCEGRALPLEGVKICRL